MKLVKKKIDVAEWLVSKGFNRFDREALALARAYADCIAESENVTEGRFPEDCTYFPREPMVTTEYLVKLVELVIPDGYNGFNVAALKAVIGAFPPGSQFRFGREGSPVLYVKPEGKGNLWFFRERTGIHAGMADEVCFDATLGMFRFWWD